MALSPISAIGAGTSSIPPVVMRQLTQVDPFVRALDTSLTGSATAVSALPAATTQNNFVSALERALFSNWVTSIQGNNASPLTSIIDSVLAGQLGITGQTTGTSQALPFDTSDPESLVLTARIISLFSTMQLLGTETNAVPVVGSLLNFEV